MKNLKELIQEKLIISKDLKQKRDPNNPKEWEVGDILAGTWGYSMTIPAFYEIIKKTPSGFTVVSLSGKIVSGHRNGDWEEIPDESKHEKDLQGKKINCRIRKGNYVKVDNCYVHLWDGQPMYGNDMD